MSVWKQLREDSLRHLLPASLALMAAGAAVYILFGCGDLALLLSPRTLAQLSPDTLAGVWVEDDISFFHVACARETTYQEGRPAKVTGSQYVVRFDEKYYMALFAHRDTLDQAEEMMAACNSYYLGEIEASQLPLFHVSGQMRPLEENELRFYMASARGDKDVEAVMIPCCLDVGYLNGRPLWVTWAALALALLLLLGGLIPGLLAMGGWYQRELRRRLQEGGEGAEKRFIRFYEAAEPVAGVRVRGDHVLLQAGARTVLCRLERVAWAYPRPAWPLLNRGKRCRFHFHTVDGKRYAVPVSEDESQALLDLLEDHAPDIALGYNREKARAYQEKILTGRQRGFRGSAGAAGGPERGQWRS